MNGQRLGAVILAIGLVVGAFALRRNVIEDDDNPTTDGTGDRRTRGRGRDRALLHHGARRGVRRAAASHDEPRR